MGDLNRSVDKNIQANNSKTSFETIIFKHNNRGDNYVIQICSPVCYLFSFGAHAIFRKGILSHFQINSINSRKTILNSTNNIINGPQDVNAY